MLRMNRGERRLRRQTALWCLILTCLVVIFESTGQLQPMERWLYDRRCRYFQFFTPEPTDKLVHVDITDPDLQNIGRWPWPRSTMAAILDEIHLAGAKAVAFDILYTEPAEIRYVPVEQVKGPSTKPVPSLPVDDDAAFAEALRRSENSLLSVGLPLEIRPAMPSYVKARELYVDDLEMSEPEVAAKITAAGIKLKETDAQLQNLLLPARREAAQIRINRELDQIEAGRMPMSQPATLPSTEAAPISTTQPALAHADQAEEPRLIELWRLILKKNDRFSPQGRLIKEQYLQVVARREMRSHAIDIPLDFPNLAQIRNPLCPLPAFTREAKSLGFVDYPVYKDGVVRSVPLVERFDDRLYPQIAFALAGMMLDVDLRQCNYTADAVIIPASANRPKITIPARIHFPEEGGNPIPMTMDVPYVGTDDWEHMFPRQLHRPITLAYEPILIRRRIADSTRELDRAVVFLLNKLDVGLDGARAADYLAKHHSPYEIGARLEVMKSLLDAYGQDIPEDAKPEDETDEQGRRTVASVQAIRSVLKLQKQLETKRAEMRRIMDGKAILIGWASTGAIADRKPTSLHPDAPGVVVHGTIFNAIMTGELWRTLPHGWTILTTLLIGLIVTVIVTILPPGRAAGYAGLLAALYIVFNGLLLFDYGNVILGLAGPFMAIALVWAVGTMVRLILEGFERARITKRFAAYVDPELVEFVLEQQNDEFFKGVQREITTVFTDLQGFTSLAEKMGKDIVPILNDFMDRATRVIKKHHGYVNKFLGDGVMFFYNAPRPRTTHARDAVATVVELYVMLEQFNKELKEKGLPTLALRAGVSTGDLIVGDAGSRERCDYTVLGDAANLAARLESANKMMGTRNMMTGRTIELAGDGFLFRPIGRLQVVGQTVGVMVYEAVCPNAEATDEQKRLAELTKAMVEASLDGRPADCLEAVSNLEEAFGETKLTHLYREKCEQHLKDPSAGEFERQIVLTSK